MCKLYFNTLRLYTLKRVIELNSESKNIYLTNCSGDNEIIITKNKELHRGSIFTDKSDNPFAVVLRRVVSLRFHNSKLCCTRTKLRVQKHKISYYERRRKL